MFSIKVNPITAWIFFMCFLKLNMYAQTTVEFNPWNEMVTEDGVSVDVCVNIYNPDATNDTTLDVIVASSSTATDGADVNTLGTTQLVFPANTSDVQCFTVTIIDDSLAEGNEFLDFEIINIAGGDNAVIGSYPTVSVNIFDNDNTMVGFAIFNSDSELFENGAIGNATANICLEIFNEDPVNATIVTIEEELFNSATSGVDYQVIGTQTITFPAGSTALECFTVSSIDDTDLEGDEYLAVEITGISGGNMAGTIIYNDSYGIFLKDDENTSVGLSTNNNLSVNEGDGTVDVCFSIVNPSATNDTNVELYAYGSADNGVDFNTMLQPEILTFPAGSSADICYTITLIDDAIIEGNEWINTYFYVNGGDAASEQSPNFQIINIEDNDLPSTEVQFEQTIYSSLNENDGTGGQASICLNITDPDDNVDTQVDVIVASSSTALDGSDIQTFGTQTITFPAGIYDQQCFDVFVIDDADTEGNEDLVLELVNVTGGYNALIGTYNTGTLTIFDNDNTNVGFSFGSGDEELHESATTGNVTADVCLLIVNEDPTIATSVDVELSMYTSATEGVDFQTVGIQTVTFPAGSNAEECFTVTSLDDTDLEGNEEIYLDITSVTGGNAAGTLQYQDQYYIDLIDNENTQVAYAATNALTVDESGGTIDICFSITNPSSTEDTYVELYLYGGATSGSDYNTVNDPETIIFPAGSSDDICFTVSIIDDTDIEGNEYLYSYFYAYGGDLAGYAGSYNDAYQTIEIIDNDLAATSVEFSQYNYLDLSEVDDVQFFCIQITDPSNVNDTQVEVVISGSSTATDGVDFNTFGTQTVTFLAGDSNEQCVEISTIDDALLEGLETVVLELQNVSGGNNAVLGAKVQETVNIFDDENTQVGFDYSFSGGSLYENPTDGNTVVDVCLFIVNEDPVNSTSATIELGMYSDIDDGVDVQTIGVQSVTFPAASTGQECFQITVIDDTVAEFSESIQLLITDVTGGSFASQSVYESEHYITVFDDDNTVVNFSTSNTGIIYEEDGSVEICLSIENPSAVNDTYVDVYFDMYTSTATNGTDFTSPADPINLTFPAGSSTDVCFTVEPIGDTDSEGVENLYFYIGNLGGGDNVNYGDMDYVDILLFDGSAGASDGIHCWDLNGDGIDDPSEDVNMDGFYNGLDCQGADGEDGVDGQNGTTGPSGPAGPAGSDGINCWDLNGDGINDASEDINMDGQYNGLDCQGADGVDGEDGVNGQNGSTGPSGPAGPAGADAIHCWDLNGDGINDASEDVNMDGQYNGLDCQGADGEDGADGQDGSDGQDGATGPQGPAGDPASSDGNGIYSGDGIVASATNVEITANLNFDANTFYIDGATNKVGIGTDNPTHALDVMGDVGISGQIYGLSDERLKTNKVPMVNALSIISQLIPNTYNFDTENFDYLNLSDKLQYGLLAQEVELVLPAIVTEMKVSENEEYKSINYNALISILVGAINEQQVKIEDQNQSLKIHKEEFEKQQEKLDLLEKKINLLLEENK